MWEGSLKCQEGGGIRSERRSSTPSGVRGNRNRGLSTLESVYTHAVGILGSIYRSFRGR